MFFTFHFIFPTDVRLSGRHHQVSLHFPNRSHQWEKYAREQIPRKLCADMSSNKTGCPPAAELTQESDNLMNTAWSLSHI